jgi:MoxR-like ATPase
MSNHHVPFRLLDPTRRDANRRSLFGQRETPKTLGSLKESAPFFQPSEALVTAVNVAMRVGAPLLLTGEPGTGKSQVAYYLAWYFDVQSALYQLDVRSSTTAEDLIYHFDSVAYFHATHDPQRQGQAIDRESFVRKGPLWLALESQAPAIVLLDEIDKAPRDFPNDILGVLDQSRFFVREWGDKGSWFPKDQPKTRPLLIITSNSERRLPEPFLRRCIFHHIEFTEDILRKAVHARRADFPELSDEVRSAAIARLMELREKPLRKKPATAELMVWLTVLAAQADLSASTLKNRPWDELPGLSALIKDRDDLESLL